MWKEPNPNLRRFVVYHGADMTEGRGFREMDLIEVYAKEKHEEFAEHWCYEHLGNKYGFIMGSRGSNCLTKRWSIKPFIGEDLDGPKLSFKATIVDECL